MDFKKHTLDNGLTIIGEENVNAKSAAIGFFVKTGSRDETPEVSGVSHFLEHMLFKGTEELSPAAVNEAFDNTGAKFNAFTSEEMTVYYAAILPEYLGEVAALWSKLMRPSLREEDFEIEKNVIKEEIAMYQDLPHYDVFDKCRTLYFQDHPCGNSVLGTNESINALKAEQMMDYFQRRYSPGNVTVVTVGNFEFDKVVNIVSELCGQWQYREVGRDTTPFGGTDQVRRETRGNLKRDHICIMSPSVASQDPRRYTAALLANIIGDDIGSRYFWKIIDKAEAEVAHMQFSSMDGTGAFASYFRCDPTNTEKVINIANEIFSDVKENGVREDELTAARNKVLSGLALKNEVPMGRLVDLGFNWLYLNDYKSTDEEVQAVKSVSVEDVNQLISEFDLSKNTIYTIGPEK